MSRLAALASLLAAAFLLFYVGARTPQPRSDGPASRNFCARCALAEIAAIAPRPHPVGSPANAAVRDYLFARMKLLGLSPRIQSADSRQVMNFGKDAWIAVAPVQNLVGVLPGRDPSLPAPALMAHYDSVPGSPGAADDATSVATILDIVRALRVRGAPERDVIVVITDGEEPGLLGARAFFDHDPAASHVGFVMNLEARGGGGRTSMFETGANDGAAIGLFQRTAVAPYSNSIFPFLYRYLPNNTDFTIAKKRGLPGFNFAFIGRQFDYHSPSSTVAALDAGAVQHMGETTLGPAAALAYSAQLPTRTPDVVYSDVLGAGVIAYPTVWGWAVIVAAAILIIAVAAQLPGLERPSWSALIQGAVAGLASLTLAAVFLYLARQATGVGQGWIPYRPLLARFPLFEAAMVLTALAGMVLGPAIFSRGERMASGWIGLLLTGLVVSIVLQAFVPLTAFLVAWPTLVGAACAALIAGGWRAARLAWLWYAMIAIVALAWIGGAFHGLLQGLDIAPACAVFAWLASLLLWPLICPPPRRNWVALGPAVLFAVAACAILLGMRLTQPWSARYPRAVEPLYVTNGKQAWRASLASTDPWTAAYLGPGARPLPNVAGAPDALIGASAPLQPAPPPVAISRGPDGSLVVRSDPTDRQDALVATFTISQPALAVEVDGAPVSALTARRSRLRIVWTAEHRPETVVIRAPVGAQIDVAYSAWLSGWPSGVPAPPPLTSTVMPWDRAGSSVFIGQERLRF
ncbi:MAG: M20/M25/M40 family metallo-hydrolase [Caulobacteraceae bacterium]|nr:M20/M25/M40 family metallo-hydrolase [Caulobacteraceae bacterium]